MNVHGDVNFLHIGCDEVYHLGECSRCRNKLKDDLFLSHVSQVARYIRKRYPYVTPIIWDDMLRHVPSLSLEQYNIGKLVEPMVSFSLILFLFPLTHHIVTFFMNYIMRLINMYSYIKKRMIKLSHSSRYHSFSATRCFFNCFTLPY